MGCRPSPLENPTKGCQAIHRVRGRGTHGRTVVPAPAVQVGHTLLPIMGLPIRPCGF
jgi:hypothetical protein